MTNMKCSRCHRIFIQYVDDARRPILCTECREGSKDTDTSVSSKINPDAAWPFPTNVPEDTPLLPNDPVVIGGGGTFDGGGASGGYDSCSSDSGGGDSGGGSCGGGGD